MTKKEKILLEIARFEVARRYSFGNWDDIIKEKGQNMIDKFYNPMVEIKLKQYNSLNL